MVQVLPAVLTLMLLGLLFGLGLAYASRVLAVKQDERVEAIEDRLPGTNCGGCGFAGCTNFSEALVEGDADVTACTVCGSDTLARIAEILGEDLDLSAEREIAVVRCRGTEEAAARRFRYEGIPDCAAAAEVGGGHKACEYGCLGQGSCVEVCPFDAIHMTPDGVPFVESSRCTGCGRCVEACPRGIIDVQPERQQVFLLCMAELGPREVRKLCTNACLGCGLCARRCPQEAIVMQRQLPVFDFDKCDGCGTCVEVCPADSLRLSSALEEGDDRAAG